MPRQRIGTFIYLRRKYLSIYLIVCAYLFSPRTLLIRWKRKQRTREAERKWWRERGLGVKPGSPKNSRANICIYFLRPLLWNRRIWAGSRRSCCGTMTAVRWFWVYMLYFRDLSTREQFVCHHLPFCPFYSRLVSCTMSPDNEVRSYFQTCRVFSDDLMLFNVFFSLVFFNFVFTEGEENILWSVSRTEGQCDECSVQTHPIPTTPTLLLTFKRDERK